MECLSIKGDIPIKETKAQTTIKDQMVCYSIVIMHRTSIMWEQLLWLVHNGSRNKWEYPVNKQPNT